MAVGDRPYTTHPPLQDADHTSSSTHTQNPSTYIPSLQIPPTDQSIYNRLAIRSTKPPDPPPPLVKEASPQILVGEFPILSSQNKSDVGNKPSFAAIAKAKPSSISNSVAKSKLSMYSNGSLQLKPLSSHLGKPSVIFKKSEQKQLIAQVRHVLIAKFSHGLPSSETMHKFLLDIKFEGDYIVSLFNSKHVFVEFELFDDFTKLWLKKNWLIKGFPVRFFKWTEKFQSRMESSFVPVWVYLPALPLYFFEEEALLSLANAIGNPLHIDKRNLDRTKIGYATVCVEVDVSKKPVDEIWIEFEEDGSKKRIDGFWQKVVYGDIPTYCRGCLHLGHNVESCKRAKVEKAEKVVPLQANYEMPMVILEVEAEGDKEMGSTMLEIKTNQCCDTGSLESIEEGEITEFGAELNLKENALSAAGTSAAEDGEHEVGESDATGDGERAVWESDAGGSVAGDQAAETIQEVCATALESSTTSDASVMETEEGQEHGLQEHSDGLAKGMKQLNGMLLNNVVQVVKTLTLTLEDQALISSSPKDKVPDFKQQQGMLAKPLVDEANLFHGAIHFNSCGLGDTEAETAATYQPFLQDDHNLPSMNNRGVKPAVLDGVRTKVEGVQHKQTKLYNTVAGKPQTVESVSQSAGNQEDINVAVPDVAGDSGDAMETEAEDCARAVLDCGYDFTTEPVETVGEPSTETAETDISLGVEAAAMDGRMQGLSVEAPPQIAGQGLLTASVDQTTTLAEETKLVGDINHCRGILNHIVNDSPNNLVHKEATSGADFAKEVSSTQETKGDKVDDNVNHPKPRNLRNSHTSITPQKLSSAAAEFKPKWAVLVEELVEGKKQSDPVLDEKEGKESLQEKSANVGGQVVMVTSHDMDRLNERMRRLRGEPVAPILTPILDTSTWVPPSMSKHLARELKKNRKQYRINQNWQDIEDYSDEVSEEGELDEMAGSQMLYGEAFLSDEMGDIPRPFKIKSAPNSPKGKNSSYDSSTYLLSRNFS